MNTLQSIISWYLGPATRIGRSGFNVIILLISCLTFLLPSSSHPEKTSNLSALSNLLDNRSTAHNAQELVQQAERTRLILEESGLSDFSNQLMHGSTAEQSLMFIAIQIAILILLIPILHMRLRDMGQVDLTKRRIYTAVALSTLLLSGINLGLDMVTSFALSTPGMVILAWMCMSGTHYVPLSKREGPSE